MTCRCVLLSFLENEDGGILPLPFLGRMRPKEAPQADVGPQHAGESMDFGSDYGLDKTLIPCAKHKI